LGGDDRDAGTKAAKGFAQVKSVKGLLSVHLITLL
jgi:hypothetical protein